MAPARKPLEGRHLEFFESPSDLTVDHSAIADLADDLVAWLGDAQPTEAIPALVDALLQQLEKFPAQARITALEGITEALRKALELSMAASAS